MHVREYTLLDMPEVLKHPFMKRLDESRGFFEGKIRRMSRNGLPDVLRRHLFDLLDEWETLTAEFDIGSYRSFGEWEDDVEAIYKELRQSLEQATAEIKKKGGGE